MSHSSEEVTTQEILEAITSFASHVEKRFDSIDQRFDSIDQEIGGIKERLTKVEATMVTKEYLDDKIADTTAKIMEGVAKRDERLIDALQEKKIFTPEEGSRLKSFQPLTPAR